MPVVIGEHEELRDAASYGQSIIEFAPGSAAEADFLALAAWLETNAPEATALRDHVGATPIVETFRDSAREMFGGNSIMHPSGNAASHAGVTADERAFFSTVSGAAGNSAQPSSSAMSASDGAATRIEDASSRSTTSSGPSRASDLVSRLRALAERSRQQSPIGAGFGVRTSRDGLVVFSQPASARGLFVVGDFNGWNPVATPLMASADGLRMEAEVELPPGRHAYRIVVDGTEQLDGFNPHRDAAREGIGASLVEVPASVAVAGARSYGSNDGGVR